MTTTTLIEVVHCETANELVAELLPNSGRIWKDFRDGASPPECMFRGQGDETWTLRPTALRPNAFGSLIETRKRQRELELSQVLQFAHMADILGHGVPGDHPIIRDTRPRFRKDLDMYTLAHFPQTELLYMFALAQHYGIPTRLLDWTSKPLIAAYFASGRPGNPTGERLAIWALNWRAVDNRIGGGAWKKSSGGERFHVVFRITAPTSSNPNLAAQGGAFTLVQETRSVDDQTAEELPDLDDLLRSNEALFSETERPVMYKFTLGHAQSRSLRRLLFEFSVHAGSVRPGLAGVAEALREYARFTNPE